MPPHDHDHDHDHDTPPRGLWIPLITPFSDGALDLVSWRKLVARYAATPVEGLIVAATTGEGLALTDAERAALVATAAAEIAAAPRRPALYLGLAGASTRALAAMIEASAPWPLNGYLLSSPYYVRPSQAGLIAHFERLAEASPRPIMLYDIPYRTGVKLEVETLLALADHPRICGVKDCGASAERSRALAERRPAGFSILTGEDHLLLDALERGADGAIFMSAHLETERFAALIARWRGGERPAAAQIWRDHLAPLAPLLTAEPSPAAVKHWLYREGVIQSPETRLPMTPASPALQERLNAALPKRAA